MNAFGETPCKDCKPPVRHVSCHAECGLYLDWLKQHRELTGKIARQNVNDSMIKDTIITGKTRLSNRRRSAK